MNLSLVELPGSTHDARAAALHRKLFAHTSAAKMKRAGRPRVRFIKPTPVRLHVPRVRMFVQPAVLQSPEDVAAEVSRFIGL